MFMIHHKVYGSIFCIFVMSFVIVNNKFYSEVAMNVDRDGSLAVLIIFSHYTD